MRVTDCADLAMPPRPTELANPLTRSVLKANAVMFLAGPLAQARLAGRELDAAESDDPDVVNARHIVEWLLGDNQALIAEVMRGEITITASDLLDNWRESIRAVASAAQERGSVSGEEIREIMAPAIDYYRRLAARHEAAHVVMLWLEGNGEVPLSVGVGRSPAEASANFPLMRPFTPGFYQAPHATDPQDRELARRELERVVAGEEAALLADAAYPGPVRARTDREEARRLAGKLAGAGHQEDAAAIEQEARANVREVLRTPAAQRLIDALVTALLEENSLGQEPIRQVLLAAEAEG